MKRTHRYTSKALISLLIALFWVAISVIPSYADVAPPPPPEGSTILPGNETTQVRMMYENVFMNIDLDGTAKVDANFVMRNLGDKEEGMEVRFPLYSPEPVQPYDDKPDEVSKPKCGGSWGSELSGSPIQDLAVWVWDKPQSVKTVYETMENMLDSSGKNVVKPCWGVFAVTFPPGLDVPIEVKYTSPTYGYVLTTGMGWNGTIGQADVTFRLPYEVTLGGSVAWCLPKTCILNGRDIQWKFIDFEPKENVSVTLIEPKVWWRILTELNNLKLNPNDIQAWKNLASAYEDSIRMVPNKGVMEGDDENYKQAQLTKETFRKAVSLNPNDANLHLHFAVFLYYQATYAYRIYEVDEFVESVQQIRRALELDPNNSNALDLLQKMTELTIDSTQDQRAVIMEDGHPVYIILTPTALPTPVPTETLVTRTPSATFTQTPSPTPTLTPSLTSTVLLDTLTPVPSSSDMGPGVDWAWVLVPLAAILGIGILRRRGKS